ncbi:Hsp20/alpha crystallin family protein [Falsiporphyromonas endometrii]|uniref:Hsp20/alpha crystallin family protein n=1 Tax=Falsiporphyromonas endometrii TaxID=1387297 RepID=A0ABV9K6P9_9PORP
MMPIKRTNDWLPSMFNDFFSNDWMAQTNATAPAINVIENKDGYQVEVAAPGMNKEDFKLHIDENNDLVISMEKKEEKKEESDGDQKPRYLRREFSYSKFRQTLILPENVDHDKIEASMNDGVLTIQIKKLTPEELKKSTREITIK